jgi:hypothetical protein
MEKNREGFLVSETHRECTNCSKVFLRTSKTVALCPSCNSTRVKCQTPERKMYRGAKCRANAKGTEFSLDWGDIVIPDTCPILGMKLVVHKGKPGGKKNSPSLDRIDSSLGYTKDNVWVISHLANQMKSYATKNEMIEFAKWILHRDCSNAQS